MNIKLLTNDQLANLWERLLRRIHREFAGGSQFGIDLPTLYAVLPVLHQDYMTLKREAQRRKLAGLV